MGTSRASKNLLARGIQKYYDSKTDRHKKMIDREVGHIRDVRDKGPHATPRDRAVVMMIEDRLKKEVARLKKKNK